MTRSNNSSKDWRSCLWITSHSFSWRITRSLGFSLGYRRRWLGTFWNIHWWLISAQAVSNLSLLGSGLGFMQLMPLTRLGLSKNMWPHLLWYMCDCVCDGKLVKFPCSFLIVMGDWSFVDKKIIGTIGLLFLHTIVKGNEKFLVNCAHWYNKTRRHRPSHTPTHTLTITHN